MGHVVCQLLREQWHQPIKRAIDVSLNFDEGNGNLAVHFICCDHETSARHQDVVFLAEFDVSMEAVEKDFGMKFEQMVGSGIKQFSTLYSSGEASFKRESVFDGQIHVKLMGPSCLFSDGCPGAQCAVRLFADKIGSDVCITFDRDCVHERKEIMENNVQKEPWLHTFEYQLVSLNN